MACNSPLLDHTALPFLFSQIACQLLIKRQKLVFHLLGDKQGFPLAEGKSSC